MRYCIIFFALFCSILSLNVFADNIAQPETTPPPPEGALSLERTPPIKLKKKIEVPKQKETPKEQKSIF